MAYYQRKAGDRITFWEVIHRATSFSSDDWEFLLNKRIIVTFGKKNIERLSAMRNGDYFYLCNWGIKLIGQIIDDEPEFCEYKKNYFHDGYKRHYKMIFPVDGVPLIKKFYRGEEKYYTSNFEGGLLKHKHVVEISQDDASDFEKNILRPFFGVGIEDFPGLWSSKTVQHHISEENSLSSNNIEPPKKIFPLNQIFYGPPGTGKTYLTRRYAVAICDNQPLENADANKYSQLCADGRVKFVTFHQSYGYEDFIEGIKPEIVNENIHYKVKAGVFKEFCDTARNKNWNFVFIIDEINRGNVSKIFGELITLIEDDKRGELSATLPYSQKEFTVPQNVYLIGTMNTADRSIALLDTALRRRFNFVEMIPRHELLSENIDGVNLQTLLDTLNTRIETHLDREHTIGHAYFIDCKTIADIAAAFRNKIIPLLQEYFFGDYALIQEVLGKKIIDAERLTDEKFRYTVNDKALLDAETYSL